RLSAARPRGRIASRADHHRQGQYRRRRAAAVGTGVAAHGTVPRTGRRLRHCRPASWRRGCHLCTAETAKGEAMTPFGERMRRLRAEKGVTQKEMAEAIGVSAAYLSALEHGRRGVPSWTLLQQIIRCWRSCATGKPPEA